MSERQEFLGSIATGVAIPILKDFISDRLKRADVPVSDRDAEAIAEQVVKSAAPKMAKEIATSPVIKNQTNNEPLIQSRVATGSTMAFLPALSYIVYQATARGFENFADHFSDPVMLVAVPAAWGGIFAFYGRVRKGLGPMKWFGLAKGETP